MTCCSRPDSLSNMEASITTPSFWAVKTTFMKFMYCDGWSSEPFTTCTKRTLHSHLYILSTIQYHHIIIIISSSNIHRRYYTVSQKKLPSFLFFRVTVKREPISIIFGIQSLEETLHQKVVNLSTSPKICHCTTL